MTPWMRHTERQRRLRPNPLPLSCFKSCAVVGCSRHSIAAHLDEARLQVIAPHNVALIHLPAHTPGSLHASRAGAAAAAARCRCGLHVHLSVVGLEDVLQCRLLRPAIAGVVRVCRCAIAGRCCCADAWPGCNTRAAEVAWLLVAPAWVPDTAAAGQQQWALPVSVIECGQLSSMQVPHTYPVAMLVCCCR